MTYPLHLTLQRQHLVDRALARALRGVLPEDWKLFVAILAPRYCMCMQGIYLPVFTLRHSLVNYQQRNAVGGSIPLLF